MRDIIDSSIITRTRKLRQSKDFNIDGNTLKFRPNRGYTANEKNAKGKTCDLIFKGYYILHGDKGAYLTRGKALQIYSIVTDNSLIIQTLSKGSYYTTLDNDGDTGPSSTSSDTDSINLSISLDDVDLGNKTKVNTKTT